MFNCTLDYAERIATVCADSRKSRRRAIGHNSLVTAQPKICLLNYWFHPLRHALSDQAKGYLLFKTVSLQR